MPSRLTYTPPPDTGYSHGEQHLALPDIHNLLRDAERDNNENNQTHKASKMTQPT